MIPFAQVPSTQITIPAGDATLSQVVMWILLGSGAVGSVWVAAKALFSWIDGQMAKKDDIIKAEREAYRAREIQYASERDAERSAHETKYETLRKECANERRKSLDDLLGLVRDGTHTPQPKEPT